MPAQTDNAKTLRTGEKWMTMKELVEQTPKSMPGQAVQKPQMPTGIGPPVRYYDCKPKIIFDFSVSLTNTVRFRVKIMVFRSISIRRDFAEHKYEEILKI